MPMQQSLAFPLALAEGAVFAAWVLAEALLSAAGSASSQALAATHKDDTIGPSHCFALSFIPALVNDRAGRE